jgi:hypothetical protein
MLLNFSIRRLSLCLLITICTGLSHAQYLTWKTGMHVFFDNREYFNSYAQDQTIFGTRIFGQTGFDIDQHHQIQAGISYLYEYGSTINSKYIEPILYYHYENEPVKLYFGSFDRKKLIELPQILQSDTFQYYRPNIEGIFIELHKTWGYQNVWIDWASRQTDKNKEIFLLGGTGSLKKGRFFYRHDFIMTHYAKTKINDSSEHIRDNGGLCAGIGVDLSHILGLDSLTLSSGFTMSYDRTRNVYDFRYYKGSLSELLVQYKSLGLHASAYIGEGQVQMVGDGLYRAKNYERIDVFWDLFRKSPVKGRVTFSIHFIDQLIDYSQTFSIYVNLEGRKTFNSFASISDH